MCADKLLTSPQHSNTAALTVSQAPGVLPQDKPDECSCSGGEGESECRILSLSLEHLQVSVDNGTVLAQNASGLQTATCLHDHWNCLLTPFLFVSLLVTVPSLSS